MTTKKYRPMSGKEKIKTTISLIIIFGITLIIWWAQTPGSPLSADIFKANITSDETSTTESSQDTEQTAANPPSDSADLAKEFILESTKKTDPSATTGINNSSASYSSSATNSANSTNSAATQTTSSSPSTTTDSSTATTDTAAATDAPQANKSQSATDSATKATTGAADSDTTTATISNSEKAQPTMTNIANPEKIQMSAEGVPYIDFGKNPAANTVNLKASGLDAGPENNNDSLESRNNSLTITSNSNNTNSAPVVDKAQSSKLPKTGSPITFLVLLATGSALVLQSRKIIQQANS